MSQLKKANSNPPVKSYLDWTALTPTCKACGQKSGRLNDVSICPDCREPEPVAVIKPKREKVARPKRPRLRMVDRPKRPRGTMANSRTPINESAVVSRYTDGETAPNIAVDLGVTAKRIRSVLDRHGIERRDDRGTHSGGKPRLYGDELIGRVRDLYLGGSSQPEVARLTGVSVKTVQTIMRRHGIPSRERQSGHADGAAELKAFMREQGLTAREVKTWAGRPSMPGLPSLSEVLGYLAEQRQDGAA